MADFDPGKLEELDGLGFDNELDYSEESSEADNQLTPLQKLEKYMESDNVYTRQMVARGLLDTMRVAYSEETTGILNAMVKLSEDPDPIVRSELMEQVPHVAVYCTDYEHKFDSTVEDYLLPMVVHYLNDNNNQVRKTSQAALLVLLEQELVSKVDIEKQVVSVILELASPDSLDDYRTEAVALMSKMAPLLGREMCERLFLKRYSEMCTDPLMHVRKVCAANFGDICTVVGEESTESQLLEKFYFLCEDGVWGVRKACAECFMTVSCCCSLGVRRSELANLFINLLCDQSRWVRVAAFQQLGPFISTFANPNMSPRDSLDLEADVEVDDLDKAAIEKKVFAELSSLESFQNNNASSEGIVIQTEESCDGLFLEEPSDKQEKYYSSCSGATDKVRNTTMSVEEKWANSFLDEVTVETNDVEAVIDIELDQYNAIIQETIVQVDSTGTDDLEFNFDQKDTNFDLNTVTTNDLVINSDEERNKNVELSQDAGSSAEENKSNSTLDSNDTVHIHLNDVDNFNSFQFWRTPLPAVALDLDLVDENPNNIHLTFEVEVENKIYATEKNLVSSDIFPETESSLTENMSSMQIEFNTDHTEVLDRPLSIQESGETIHTASVSTVSETHETVDNIGSMHVLGQSFNESTMLDGIATQDLTLGHIDSNLLLSLLPIADSNLGYADHGFSSHDGFQDDVIDDTQLAQQQDIVPQNLLGNYLGMVDPARAQTVDSDITKHCAFNIPAVALTLGRRNWHCIKNLYETLASDMQWKVRKTLAYSIHELAVILGEDITHTDLVPVFDGFLKDLDEVRIGVLRHLADFLQLLHPDIRNLYLPRIQDFMTTDNHRNWRFRLELAEQLVSISELYSAYEVNEYLLPIGIALIGDRVAEVRIVSYRLISIILRRFNECGDEKLKSCLVRELNEKFAQNPKCVGRKIYCQLCHVIFEENVMPPEQFAQDFLPSLLLLVNDPIPNVRISLAKAIAQYSQNEDIVQSLATHSYEELFKAMKTLQSDGDRDVSYFASYQTGFHSEF